MTWDADEDDAGLRFIAAGILPRYFLAESGFSGKTAAGNFSLRCEIRL